MERVIEAFRNMAASGLLVPDPLCENAIISFLFPLSSLSFVLLDDPDRRRGSLNADGLITKHHARIGLRVVDNQNIQWIAIVGLVEGMNPQS
jgi:hypothetical protein